MGNRWHNIANGEMSIGRRLRWAWAVVVVVMIVAGDWAMAQDTVHTLGEVEVSSQRLPATLRTAAPTQVVDAAKIEAQGALLLSDAVRLMAGVELKDYGGVGGLKTVSARGLGSQFSTVAIDGVAVNDAQNGQVDLGRYLVGNAAFVSFSQGQQQQQLLTARLYAAGNVLEIESAEPRFFLAERTNIKVGMETGNYGLVNPTALWEQKWSRKLKSSLWFSWLESDGNYPFTLYYTASQNDSSSRELRQHSASSMLTTDGALFYTPGGGRTLTVKMHYMHGQHQLPGPVHLYRQAPSAENTREEVAFVQARWRLERERWKVQAVGKVQTTFDRYEDSAASTFSRYLCNEYRQGEAYASGSAVWSPAEWIDVSAAADGSEGWLRSNLWQRNRVRRQNATAVAAVRMHGAGLDGRVHLLASSIADHVADLDTTPRYRRLSPYAGLTFTPCNGNITLRYFYKETYRAPNFSELYYMTLPRDLRPERARQHNVGCTYANEHISATLDAYYNQVSDKILAIPTQNMFLWSMQNLGKAEIAGVDATLNSTIALKGSLLMVQGNYTYQHAVDRTDPNGRTYGHQIAYMPRHTGGGSLRWETPLCNLGLTARVVGQRYYRMQNTEDALMPAYCDIGLNADRQFDMRWGTLTVQVQVLNLTDSQYEVVRAYPMMGRSYRLKLTYQL